MKIVFASGNVNKLEQVRRLLDNESIVLPKDIGLDNFEVDEDGDTLEKNAYKKASTIYNKTKRMVFSDDTGLFVKALDYRPGVKSHRYAKEDATDKDNRAKLLQELEGISDRSAFFKTVICLSLIHISEPTRRPG